MHKGDSLASGAKSATFAATDNPNRLSAEEYAERVGGCVGLPSAEDLDTVAAEQETAELTSHVDNSQLFAQKKPAVIYKGKPLGDMVLVRRVERESASLIVIPDSARGKSDMGVVANAGPGITDIHTGKRTELTVKSGDLVMFDKFAAVGMEISLMDENGAEIEYLILREHDILLTLEKVETVN